jgi:hypothetical protein
MRATHSANGPYSKHSFSGTNETAAVMFLTDLISLYSTNIIVWEGPSHESSGFPPLDFLDIVIVAHTILFIFYDI